MLRNHQKFCLEISSRQSIKMVEKGSSTKFSRCSRQLMAPLIIYADFESDVVDSKEGKFDDSCSDKYQDHVACSYGYKLVYVDGRFSKFICLLMI